MASTGLNDARESNRTHTFLNRTYKIESSYLLIERANCRHCMYRSAWGTSGAPAQRLIVPAYLSIHTNDFTDAGTCRAMHQGRQHIFA